MKIDSKLYCWIIFSLLLLATGCFIEHGVRKEDVLKEDLQGRSDIFRLARAGKVTMTGLRELLQQRSIRVASQTECKQAHRRFAVAIPAWRCGVRSTA